MRSAEQAHGGHGHDHGGHAGHADVYRRRFWINLILAVPVVVYSEMIQDWFGFTAPEFWGDGLVAPVLGAAGARRLHDAIERVDSLADVGELARAAAKA